MYKRTLPYVVGAVVLICTALAYWPGIRGPFVFDDLTNILLKPALRITHLDWHSIEQAALCRNDNGFPTRPIAMASFALNYYFDKFNPYSFKITNLVIHLLTGCALYWLSLLLLRRHHARLTHPPFTEPAARWLALATAGIWLLHPLNLTAVLYIVQRMESLAALFIVLGLIGYVVGREQIIGGRRAGFFTIASSIIVFGLLATLTKENGVLIFPYAAVIEAVFYRWETAPTLSRGFKVYWLCLIAFPIVAGMSLAIFNVDNLAELNAYTTKNFTLTQRLLTESRALWFYLRLIVVPDIRAMGLYHDDFGLSRGLLHPVSTLFAVIGIFVIAIVAVAAMRKIPILSFGLAWFLVGHSLESTIIPLQLVQEYRNYLPSFGIILMLVYYVAYPVPWAQRTLTLRYAFLVFYALFVGASTAVRSSEWRSEWTLYNAEVDHHPRSADAHTQFAILLGELHYDQLARQEFEKAATLNPGNSTTIIRLAQYLFLTTGKIPVGVLHQMAFRLQHNTYSPITLWIFDPLLRATAKNPHLNLQLIRMYEDLIRRRDITLPRTWRESAYKTLALAYQNDSHYPKALYYFAKARELRPSPPYYIGPAEIYAKTGQIGRAKQMIAELERHTFVLTKADQQHLQVVQAMLRRNS